MVTLMADRVFISHADEDQEAAAILAKTLSRVSLRQASAWYSSDRSPSGGMTPGQIWPMTVLERLAQVDTVIALLTPNSLAKPWLYFESGFVARAQGAQVIPVCLGLESTQVPYPLAMYQLYELSNAQSFSTFLDKLLAKLDLHYDAEMARPVIASAAAELSRMAASGSSGRKKRPPSATSGDGILDEMKAQLDRRFMELAQLISAEREGTSAAEPAYNVPIEVNFKRGDRPVIVLVNQSTTVQEVLNSTYFGISDWVNAYTYLQSWILVRSERGRTKRPLIIRGLSDEFPAREIFTPGSAWQAVELNQPYVAGRPLDTNIGEIPERGSR
jgi:hypothetical protein